MDLPLSLMSRWKGPKTRDERGDGLHGHHHRFRKINASDAIVKCVMGDNGISTVTKTHFS